MRKLLLLVGQRAPSVALGWEQTVLSQREGQRETMMDSCLLPHTLQGQEGTKLSTFLLSCLPQEPDQLRRRGLEGFTEDHCQCIAQMAFLTPYLIVGCWGRNRQQPYPTAPEAKILMEASSSGLPRESHSHPNLPLCSSPFLQELAEQMGFVPWLASIPVLALEPARQQKGSGEPLSSSSHAGSNSAGRT